jgi:hypothetical protein
MFIDENPDAFQLKINMSGCNPVEIPACHAGINPPSGLRFLAACRFSPGKWNERP